jgi:hypothetical protein
MGGHCIVSPFTSAEAGTPVGSVFNGMRYDLVPVFICKVHITQTGMLLQGGRSSNTT